LYDRAATGHIVSRAESEDNVKLPAHIERGRHEPMGALARDGGVNFAVFSEHATQIELCIFDGSGTRELKRYTLHGPHDGIFHGFLSDVGAGLVYGLRAHGAYAPLEGHRFNANKLLLDPWAREIVGRFSWRAEHHGYELGHPDGARSFDCRDNAVYALKARVASPSAVPNAFANAPRHAPADLVLYEMHVKGFSMARDEVPAAIRGTYAGLAHEASIKHLRALGVNAVSLLPVQYAIDEPALVERGLKNYWGYNTLGFFCADPRLSCTPDDPTATNAEFRAMVDALHAHDIEVVMDVVYNHTPEGNEYGPTLSFRGLDNASWYRLIHDDKSRAENLTGCGNTLNVQHPRVTQFVLDSLRFWVQEMGVDGFRFDLAPVLGRRHHGFDSHAAFFTAMRQDPILSRVHLIAEPWDSGYDGYQLGRFPGRFMEWNDKFRDAIRGYWLKSGVTRGELARRFTASSDVFHHGQRKPNASVNFITAHDGFTLADVVRYGKKHNHANGEENRDGRDNELSANFGVEGVTSDASINRKRNSVQRAMLATLLLAQGTPMLTAGDEFGNTQYGNNNAYCQDNDTGWLKWAKADQALQNFVADVIALRKNTALLRHDDWFVSHHEHHDAAKRSNSVHVQWLTPSGHEMQIHDWHDHGSAAFSCCIARSSFSADAPMQNTSRDISDEEAVLICFNPDDEDILFTLPTTKDRSWQLMLSSSPQHVAKVDEANAVLVEGRSLVVLHVTPYKHR
jgi:isoamylase